MNKIIALILALVMAMSLVACGAEPVSQAAPEIIPDAITSAAPETEEITMLDLDNNAAESITNALIHMLTTHDDYETFYRELSKYACDTNVSSFINVADEENLDESFMKPLNCHEGCSHYAWDVEPERGVRQYAAGDMYGVTITFHIDQVTETDKGYVFTDGIINEFMTVNQSQMALSGVMREEEPMGGVKIAELDESFVAGLIGELDEACLISSEEYINSNLTVFICFNENGTVAVHSEFDGGFLTAIEPVI